MGINKRADFRCRVKKVSYGTLRNRNGKTEVINEGLQIVNGCSRRRATVLHLKLVREEGEYCDHGVVLGK
jgi:hypothetical protein